MNPVVLLDEVDKLSRRRMVGRPDRGAARGARPGAEPHVPRPLPRGRPRPVATSCSSPPPTCRHHPGTAARPHGVRPPRRLHRRREGLHRPSGTCCRDRSSCAGLRDGEVTVDDATHPRRHHAATRARRACARWSESWASLARKVAAKVSIDSSETLPSWSTPADLRDLARPGRRSTTRSPSAPAARRRHRSGRHRDGGDVLFIETTAFPTCRRRRARSLTLTGQLGDVMKESAQIALNYVRSHADRARRRPGRRCDGESTSTCPPVPCPRTARLPASR